MADLILNISNKFQNTPRPFYFQSCFLLKYREPSYFLISVSRPHTFDVCRLVIILISVNIFSSFSKHKPMEGGSSTSMPFANCPQSQFCLSLFCHQTTHLNLDLSLYSYEALSECVYVIRHIKPSSTSRIADKYSKCLRNIHTVLRLVQNIQCIVGNDLGEPIVLQSA